MDVWEFAINMEKDGEKYYREQAEKEMNKDGRLESVFSSLSKDEKMHADVLEKKRKRLDYELKKSNVSEYSNVFSKEEDFEIETKEQPKQIDFYRMALEKEQESIDLYRKMLSEADGIKETDLFGWLIEQEEKHYNLLYDLITLLERAESWVEDSEFGIREDY